MNRTCISTTYLNNKNEFSNCAQGDIILYASHNMNFVEKGEKFKVSKITHKNIEVIFAYYDKSYNEIAPPCINFYRQAYNVVTPKSMA